MMIPLFQHNDICGHHAPASHTRGANEESSPSSPVYLNNHRSKPLKRRAMNVQQPTRNEAKTTTQSNNTSNLPSINSGFLAGLFDDVTKINVLKQLKLVGSDDSSTIVGEETDELLSSSKCTKTCGFSNDTNHSTTASNVSPVVRTVSPSSHPVDVSSTELDPLRLLGPISSNPVCNYSSRPAKKSRFSMIHVPSLTGLQNLDRASYWTLTERSSTLQAQSRELLSTFVSHPESNFHGDSIHDTNTSTAQKTLTRESSLSRLFSQVSFLESQFSNIHSNPATFATSRLAKAPTFNKFPMLPCTISESSCDELRRLPRAVLLASNREISSSNIDESSSFGWFVDTDDDHAPGCTGEDSDPNSSYADETPLSYQHSIFAKEKNSDLSFQSPTAPKGRSIQDDAEIEWAQAADTVDSVLGCIF